MKKTSCRIKNFLILLFAGSFFVLTLSCGLDTYEVIYPPYAVSNLPEITDYDSIQDFVHKDFTFTTKENVTYSEVKLLGTDVYYKIYNNYNEMISERSTLINLSESAEYSNNSAVKMMTMTTSGDYGYQKLKTIESKNEFLIPADGADRIVVIRLSNYLEYEAKLEIEGSSIIGGKKLIPCREKNNRTFDFGRDGNNDGIPLEGDDDYNYSSTTSYNGYYYIPLFAVSVARDTTYTQQYSKIVYLGTVIIDSGSENN